MLENAVPAAAGEPDAEDIGTRQLEITRPPPIPGGIETLPDLSSVPAFATARSAASQQGGEGYVDPEFEVQTRSERGKLESNGKVIYISGLAPSGSGSSSKVDTWSRIKAMRLPGAEEGGSGSLMHARPDHLDDLWLLSAIACLTPRPELLARVHQSDESLGVHAVRLYKDGEAKGVAPEWTTVVVDDQLPCHGKKKPIYSTNVDPGAGPVAAIQKALAKLYGCYEQLNGGRVGSALEDLTGGVSDKIYLRDGIASAADGAEKQPHISVATEAANGADGVLWQRLNEILSSGHLLAATYKVKYAEQGKTGIEGVVDAAQDRPAMPLKVDKPPGNNKDAAAAAKEAERRRHRSLAYPIVEFRVVEGAGGFVRLRNPWAKVGESEAPVYKGDWGPNAASWQNVPDVAQALGGRPRDSSFWMTWTDFLAGFNKCYVCYLQHAPSNTIVTVEGEWDEKTGGGRLSAAPGAKWRSNPQYRLVVKERCTVMIALSQQDAQTDANDASDSYPHAIGFHLIGRTNKEANLTRGDYRTLSYSDGPLRSSRYANSRQVCRLIELEPSGPEMCYNLMPATWDPNVYMPFTLSVAASAPVTLEPISTDKDYLVASATGAWAASGKTAGGCPNFADSWTQNPQIRLTTTTGGSIGVGVLSISMPEQELRKFQMKHEQLEAAGRTEEILSIGIVVIPIAEQPTGGGAAGTPAKTKKGKPALNKRLTTVALSGTVPLEPGAIICSSQFVHGAEEQATVSLDLPEGPGSYLIVPTTYFPGQECAFSLTLYHTDPGLVLVPLKGARLPQVVPPGGKKGESKGSGKLGPPIAKHDVNATRAAAKKASEGGDGAAAAAGGGGKDEIGDDGKMGYAQRMEIEEAMRLSKHPENVPLFTVEGAPLSENVKKDKDQKVAKALAYCKQHGTKFEDSGPGGFPAAPGKAEGSHQPECYPKGRSGTLPEVVQWLRPEEMAGADRPVMFRNEYSVEGIIQGQGFDNRWFISTANIVSANRGQFDRMFFGELCDEWIDNGFFVVKFYQDDPSSDDDWQVILVDDRIPCGADGRPTFAKNPDPNVYWAMIVEKAYAKMVGSYEAMQGGTVTQGLEDFTGGIGYKFDLEKKEGLQAAGLWIPKLKSTEPDHPDRDPDRLWIELLEKMMTEHVVGAVNNTKGQERPQSTKKGIVLNRAYAVVTCGDFEDHRLMKLRLPLAEDENGEVVAKEWNGAWSDGSAKWNNRLRQMLAYSNDDSDGTFWMEYKDLCRHFNKIYMCRMLDDLWTRITVKSRWMDETAGGCTNYISWRNNNQWLITVTRPNTKIIMKLSQPDARKSSGNGRHYSNAIGFYILKGNAPNAQNDHKKRKLIAKDGDADDEENPGDFVFCKEPRFSKQVVTEYTFEEASTTPYVIVPFIFEPGREQLFKFTILSDDRDDDGEPDFFFQEVRPSEDWKRLSILDAFHRGGKGNPLKKYNLEFQGDKGTSGGDPLDPSCEKTWTKNSQFQLTLFGETRVFIFLEARNVKTDMRDVEGLQTEPDYPTMGFHVCKGRGYHQLLGPEPPEVLYTAPAKFGDGVYLELGTISPEPNKYVIIPFASEPGVEYEWCLQVYTDVEADIEKIDPNKVLPPCIQCTDPKSYAKVTQKLAALEAKYAQLMKKEAKLKALNKFGTPRDMAAYSAEQMKQQDEMIAAANAEKRQAAAGALGGSVQLPPAQPGESAADRLFRAAAGGDGLVSRSDAELFRKYCGGVTVDDAGRVTEADMQRATAAVQRTREEQRVAFEAREAQFQKQLADSAGELQQLMEAVRIEKETKRRSGGGGAAARGGQPQREPARGPAAKAARRARSKSP